MDKIPRCPDEVLEAPELSDAEFKTWCAVRSVQGNNEYATCGLTFLCERSGKNPATGKPGLSRRIKSLAEKGWIEGHIPRLKAVIPVTCGATTVTPQATPPLPDKQRSLPVEQRPLPVKQRHLNPPFNPPSNPRGIRPPSLAEVTEKAQFYSMQHDFQLDPNLPQNFLDYYESVGWLQNGQKIRRWDTVLTRWIRKDQKKENRRGKDFFPSILNYEQMIKQMEKTGKKMTDYEKVPNGTDRPGWKLRATA